MIPSIWVRLYWQACKIDRGQLSIVETEESDYLRIAMRERLPNNSITNIVIMPIGKDIVTTII